MISTMKMRIMNWKIELKLQSPLTGLHFKTSLYFEWEELNYTWMDPIELFINQLTPSLDSQRSKHNPKPYHFLTSSRTTKSMIPKQLPSASPIWTAKPETKWKKNQQKADKINPTSSSSPNSNYKAWNANNALEYQNQSQKFIWVVVISMTLRKKDIGVSPKEEEKNKRKHNRENREGEREGGRGAEVMTEV